MVWSLVPVVQGDSRTKYHWFRTSHLMGDTGDSGRVKTHKPNGLATVIYQSSYTYFH